MIESFSELTSVCNGSAGEVAASPRVLEIKTTCDPIDIEDFSSEVEVRLDFALHGLEVYVLELHTAAGDKFIFVDTFP